VFSFLFWVLVGFLCHNDTILFWFSLQGGCGDSKKVLFFSLAWVGHMDKTLEVNFCVDLICKVVSVKSPIIEHVLISEQFSIYF